MKVAVSAAGGSLSAQVEGRFGRCAYFVIVDTDTMKFTAFANPSRDFTGGAGPAASEEIARHGVQAVLTGQVGGNAQQALDAAKIQVVMGMSGTVKEAIEKYKDTMK